MEFLGSFDFWNGKEASNLHSVSQDIIDLQIRSFFHLVS